MATIDTVTRIKRGKFIYDIKFDPDSEGLLIRCCFPKRRWDFIRLFGFPIIPWKIKYTERVYFDGQNDSWYISDHYDPGQRLVRDKLTMKKYGKTTVNLQSLAIAHSAAVIQKVVDKENMPN